MIGNNNTEIINLINYLTNVSETNFNMIINLINNLECGGGCNLTEVLNMLDQIFILLQNNTEIVTDISSYIQLILDTDIQILIKINEILHWENMTVTQILFILEKLEEIDLDILISFLNGTELTITDIYQFFQLNWIQLDIDITDIKYLLNWIKNSTDRIEDCACGNTTGGCDCKWYYLYRDCEIQCRCRFPLMLASNNTCVPITCFGLGYLNPNVCNGNGVCIEYNHCECRGGWDGDQCENYCG